MRWDDGHRSHRAVLLVGASGLREIAGGYPVWLWPPDHRAARLEAPGGLVLFLFGILPALLPESPHYGRRCPAHAGMFVAMSLAWRWAVDGIRPDRYDLIGGVIALAGVAVIMYASRS